MATDPTASRPAGIDPRGPRVTAAITSVLLLLGTFLSLVGSATRTGTTLADRAADPGFLVLALVAVLFAWGVTSPRTAPWAVLFRTAIRPRLTAPTELEDPRPPRFAQGVGLFVVGLGLILHLVGVPWALPAAGAAAFVAAFLNAVFAFCLGCQIYLGLTRAGLLRPQGGLVGAS
ncbi:DUF4395 domain-containing protein [Microbacterium sp. T2.11-28]|uniref:DUF4395 domain-containing protein n=1 Tax=unclassified Microbacterium TaxID=2609290 RepID=UPI0024778714|nr:DUF4395 domain-containing protein [Microbacterium sp. T2.11-28]CAI9388452.1 hypothetical protein MICABA_03061 [Microbacterium sp. T2.11-28]